MNRVLSIVLSVGFLTLDIQAQDAASLIEASAQAMGTSALQAIQYSGTGTNNSVGQAATPGGPWPRFKVTKYAALVNYAVPAMRQEIIRVDNEYPPRGGGAGPFNPSTGQGGIRPIPGDILQNQNVDGRTEVGALNIWMTPHGFVKGAAANVASAKLSTVRGKKILSFSAFGKYTVTGVLDDRNLVERVETRIYNNFTGDTLIEGIYSDYRDFKGVKFPMNILQRQGGHPTLDIRVVEFVPNSSAALEFRGNPPRGGGPVPAAGAASPTGSAVRIQPEKIGNGIWFLTFGAPQSILVEFSDHVIIIEAPSNDERTLATLAEVKRMLPGKPVRYLVSTHHHADHSGGIRAYVAEGIPVISHESNKRYYEEIFKNPHTLNPDHLARKPRALVIEAVKDKRVLADSTMRLELYHLRGNLHSEGLLVAYIPQEKLLIQADAFAPRPGVPPLPAPSPYTTNLVENIKRLKLDVERVAHVHGGVDPYAAVRKAAGLE
jgi:glyoxylase-like metal-dependent hydrolase (beta-lactamase superfamily II)